MTRIVCISDSHGHQGDPGFPQIPDGDILVHAGDLTQDIGRADLRNFLKWFEAQPHKHKVFIAGNHDGALEKWPDLARQMIRETAPSCTYLQDSGCEIMGLKLWGMPYTPTFYNWFFMRDPGEAMARHCDMIPGDTDVLVTHGPPFGFLDKSNNWNSATGEKFKDCLGSRDLRDAMYRVRPLLHVYGHIHGSGGRQTTYIDNDGHKTILVNASLMDEAYIPNHKPVVIDLC